MIKFGNAKINARRNFTTVSSAAITDLNRQLSQLNREIEALQKQLQEGENLKKNMKMTMRMVMTIKKKNHHSRNSTQHTEHGTVERKAET